MAKKQTRRSISINRRLYDRFKAFAESNNAPLSALTENAIIRMMNEKEDQDARRVHDDGGRESTSMAVDDHA